MEADWDIRDKRLEGRIYKDMALQLATPKFYSTSNTVLCDTRCLPEKGVKVTSSFSWELKVTVHRMRIRRDVIQAPQRHVTY